MSSTIFLASFNPITSKQLGSIYYALSHEKDKENHKILLVFLEGSNLEKLPKRMKMAELALEDRFGKNKSFHLFSLSELCYLNTFEELCEVNKEKFTKIYFNLEDASLVDKETLLCLLNHENVKLDATYSSLPYQNGKNLSLPFPVLQYIAENKLYYARIVASFLNEHRYRHSISVANTAYEMTVNNNFKNLAIKAYTAGLYHDIAKDLTPSLLKEIVKSYYSDRKKIEDFAWHQFAGAHLAKELFGIKDEDILEPIEYHCTGKEGMSFLQKILYASDKVEPLREFKTEEIRSLCNMNIRKGFKAVLEDQRKYFEKNNIDYRTNEYTKNMYDYYLKKGA